jgi:hypothetical protein
VVAAFADPRADVEDDEAGTEREGQFGADYTARPRRGRAGSYFFTSGFQFISRVTGEVASSLVVLIRNRPSAATSYCRLLSELPPVMDAI